MSYVFFNMGRIYFILIDIIHQQTLCLTHPEWCSWFFDGILSSGAVWAINSIVEWFEENRPSNKVN
jgi:hypothetical protein